MQSQFSDLVFLTVTVAILLLFLLSFIAALLLLYQKRNIIYLKELEDIKNLHEKNLLQTQIEIQEQTFQDISREIHDNIGLTLTLAKLQLTTMNGSKVIHGIDNSETITLISKAIEDLSYLSKSLNTDAVTTHGLYNSLKMEIEKIKRSGIQNIDFMVSGDVKFLEGSKEIILYRIVQESLNNTLRHAMATNIKVTLKYDIDKLEIVVKDDGQGFDLQNLSTAIIPTGIQNMRKRAESLNGSFCIESQHGFGTSVSITVPINENNDTGNQKNEDCTGR